IKPQMNAGKRRFKDLRLPAFILRLYVLISSREIGLALSTLDGTHRRYRAFFVGGNGGDVFLFHVGQGRVGEVWIGLVPVETREVFLKPRLLEYFTVTRVDFLAHLARVFEEQTFQQRARDGRRAQFLVNPVFVLDDSLDVDLVVPGKLFVFEVFVRRVPGLIGEVLLQPIGVKHAAMTRIDFISQQTQLVQT